MYAVMAPLVVLAALIENEEKSAGVVILTFKSVSSWSIPSFA